MHALLRGGLEALLGRRRMKNKCTADASAARQLAQCSSLLCAPQPSAPHHSPIQPAPLTSATRSSGTG